MRLLQKYEICLLLSTPSIDCPPFLKVIYASDIQRDQFTFIQNHLDLLNLQQMGLQKFDRKVNKHKECNVKNMDVMHG